MSYMTKDIDADARKYIGPKDYIGAEIERRGSCVHRQQEPKQEE